MCRFNFIEKLKGEIEIVKVLAKQLQFKFQRHYELIRKQLLFKDCRDIYLLVKMYEEIKKHLDRRTLTST